MSGPTSPSFPSFLYPFLPSLPPSLPPSLLPSLPSSLPYSILPSFFSPTFLLPIPSVLSSSFLTFLSLFLLLLFFSLFPCMLLFGRIISWQAYVRSFFFRFYWLEKSQGLTPINNNMVLKGFGHTCDGETYYFRKIKSVVTCKRKDRKRKTRHRKSF